MTLLDTIVTFVILFGLGYVIYTKIKKQDLRDTFEEIKGLFKGKGGQE